MSLPDCRRADYETVLRISGRASPEVRLCVRAGSHVYGTARPDSDRDFVLVLFDRGVRRDLLWGENANVVVHGADTFSAALEEQSLFALEALFAPSEHRLQEASPPFPFRLHPGRLFESARARSDADWAKARKRFDDEPEASKKRALHALRVLAFAQQVMETGRIVDFRAAVPWWDGLRGADSSTWDAVERGLGPPRDELVEDLRRRSRGVSRLHVRSE